MSWLVYVIRETFVKTQVSRLGTPLRVALGVHNTQTHTHDARRSARTRAAPSRTYTHVRACVSRSAIRVSPLYPRKRWPPRKRTVVMLTLSFASRSRHVLVQREVSRACVRTYVRVRRVDRAVVHRASSRATNRRKRERERESEGGAR